MKLYIGMIGTGWFSKVHAQILSEMENVQIQAVCGTNKAKAEELASELTFPQALKVLVRCWMHNDLMPCTY